VGDRDHLDALEAYLEHAPVIGLAAHEMGGGGHPGSYLVILEGGVGCLAKRESANAEAPQMVRRERAAWILARALGWNDLVSATVLRAIPGPGGDEGIASMQILWPANDVGVPGTEFSEDDRWRAAIFDALIRSTDRHQWNWLGVPRDPGGTQRRLKLIDHGHAFDLRRGLLTPFYLEFRGQAIPAEYVENLDRLDLGALHELLAPDERDATAERLELLREGVLDINEP
jgi:hypothetical protein